MHMTQEKQLRTPKPSKNADLEKLMREFGCTNNDIADYPINDLEARRRIGELISGAVQGHSRQYTVGFK
jgi:hypothetical protein